MVVPEPSQLDRRICIAGKRFRGLGQSLGRDENSSLDVGIGRSPLEFTYGETEAVGSGEDDRILFDLDTDTREHRKGVVLAGCNGYLADGFGEQVDGNGPGLLRKRRKLGVVLDRHRGQGELGASARDEHASALEGHIDRLVGKRLGDICEEATGDECLTCSGDICRDADLRGYLVVEPGNGEAGFGCVEKNSAENRHGRPRGQATSNPRY